LPRSRRQRNADIKLIAAATVAVLLAGFVIAAGIYVATDSGSGPTCGELTYDAADIRDRLEQSGPELRAIGGGCSFWLALDESDIVAYKVREAGRDCVLEYKSEFECGGEQVDLATIGRYPTRIVTRNEEDVLVIDLRPPSATSTAT
jgi:hypothetical protein